MVGKKNQSALLAKYFGMYKKNPRSKVFAPLAEAFRKLGMLDDAFKVLKDGLKHHPNYPLGISVLAHCYYDQQKYELAYNALRPIVSKNADNISMQKIFGQCCLHLGYLEEALDTYKYLLFMSPRDKFFAEQVKKLEDDLMVGHKKLGIDQLVRAPDFSSRPETAEDDWVQVDFNRSPGDAAVPLPLERPSPGPDEWVMKRPELSEHPILKKEDVPKRDLEDEYYADEFEQEHGDIEEVNAQSVALETPLVSHTLIDLYCAQEYYDKAVELLEKIIELNPQDQVSFDKLKQVRKLRDKKRPGALKVISEQDGHDELISIIETQVKARSPKEILVEAKFKSFLDAINERAREHR